MEIAWTATAKLALVRLLEKVAAAVCESVYGGLAGIPQQVGKALRLQLEGLHSARRGDFRIIYRTGAEVVILAE